MSELDLDAIEARASAAFEGPWTAEMLPAFRNGQDAEFIAHARTDVPALVSRVRELEAIIRRVAEYTVSDRTIIRVAGELQDILGDELPRGLS